MVKYLHGVKIPSDIAIPAVLIDKNNVDEYLK